MLNFVSLLAPAAGVTTAEIADHVALVLLNEFHSVSQPETDYLQSSSIIRWNSTSGTITFTPEDNAMLLSVNSSYAIEKP